MKKISQYDYLIIGGGLSGLSLAVKLHKNGLLKNKKLIILEQRSHYQYDKTWCSWQLPMINAEFSSCIAYRWKTWCVGYNDERAVIASRKYPYVCIPSDKFYENHLDYIQQCAEISLETECYVQQILGHDVKTNKGIARAEKIYDARPKKYQLEDYVGRSDYLLQCFHGFFITVDKDIFDDKSPVLMDFPKQQSCGLNFMYLLPFSERRALIEPTFFLAGNQVPAREIYLNLVKDYLAKKYACYQFEIEKEEFGILPMQVEKKSIEMNSFVTSIGTAAGLLRPSSGYAFYAIQRYINQLIQIEKIKKNKKSKKIKKLPYRQFTLLMDRIFILSCNAYPQAAAKMFYDIVSKTPAERFIRFMQDEASFFDYLSIMIYAPKIMLIKSAVFLFLKELMFVCKRKRNT